MSNGATHIEKQINTLLGMRLGNDSPTTMQETVACWLAKSGSYPNKPQQHHPIAIQ
jgi:hypothetical protein